MKKEHKTMSVVGALIVLLLVGYLYNRSNKEGMASDSAKNVRSSDPKLNNVPKSPTEHLLYFLSMAWIVELFNKLTGKQKTQVASAIKARAAQPNAARRNIAASRGAARRARSAAMARAGVGGAAQQRAARSTGANAVAARARAAAAVTRANSQRAGKEAFSNRARVGRARPGARRGGPWRPPGAVAPM